MTTKKTATKKAVTKRVSKTSAESLLPGSMWIISERKLMTWTPVFAFTREDQAREQARLLDDSSGLSFNKYKVDQVAVVQ